MKGKAESGCSAVAIYIDLSHRKYYVANVGTSQCVVGSTAGSFNSKSCNGNLVTTEHVTR